MRSQGGFIGAVVLAILALVLIGLVATYVLERLGIRGDTQTQTNDRMRRAAEALERFAMTDGRLPCPADPAADTGAEVKATVSTCTHGEGTLPWATIGAAREDSFDAWGRKLSYRVYTGGGGNGSLTQPAGVNMTNCDLHDPAPVLGANGVCNNPDPNDPGQRNTTKDQFLAGKGLSLNALGTAYSDVAYLIISHGETGLGAYSASGVRKELPTGSERNNTRDTGPFRLEVFSGPDVGVSAGTHFDDLIVYRRLEEMIKRIHLYAREWPDSTSQTFSAAEVDAAAGTSGVSSGTNIGTQVDFGPVTVSAYTGGAGSTTTAQITFVQTGSTGGLGVAGRISSLSSEFLRFEFDDPATTFAVTLDGFNKYDFFVEWTEQAELRFYNGTTPVGTAIAKGACRHTSTGITMASFGSISPGGSFNRVEIQAKPATAGAAQFLTEFTVAAVKACSVLEASCSTSLTVAGNTCS